MFKLQEMYNYETCEKLQFGLYYIYLLSCTPLTIDILCVNRLDDTDPVGAGEDDGSMLLPCEFCNELFPLDILVQHQVKPGFFINFAMKEFCNE